MRVAVVGTGGVGAYFGGRLAQAGERVAFVARGAHLLAMREHGLRVDSVAGDFVITPVEATDEPAREELWPHHRALMSRIGAERGWPPITRAQFEREAGPDGALFVGSPETVAAKIVQTAKTLGLSRFDMKYSNGALPHDKLLASIELYGTRVVPLVREQLEGKVRSEK